jgi:hypothetical protein
LNGVIDYELILKRHSWFRYLAVSCFRMLTK